MAPVLGQNGGRALSRGRSAPCLRVATPARTGCVVESAAFSSMRIPIVVFLAVALALGNSAALTGQDATALERRADSVFVRFQTGLGPGAAVAVVREGKVVFRKGYGYASLEHRVPITPSSSFDAASVSKQFTGLAISMLVEQGTIGLKDDVRKYIPEMHAFETPITIEHLLHHTSGLRDWPGMLRLAGWNSGDVIAFDHILRFASSQRTLNFKPGAEHTYSNTGYNLLAEVVARATGKSFRAWSDENIFRPLGMTNTHFRTTMGDVFPERAYSYARGADSSWSLIANGLLAQGSSSLFTTADDLAKWIINYGTYDAGGRPAVERMLQPGRLNDGSPVRYAYGVNVDITWRGTQRVTHNGSWAGYTSYSVYFPALRGGVVLLSNAGMNADQAGIALTNIFFENDLEAEDPVVAAGAARDTMSAPALDDVAGIYKLGPGWYAHIRRDGELLHVRATQEEEAPMTMRTSSEFWVAAYGASMTFVKDADGRVRSLRYRGRVAPRVEAREAPLRNADYEGNYESTELSVTYEVVTHDSALLMRNFRRGAIRLTRALGDDFRETGGLTSVAFERDASQRVIAMIVNIGDRNRNVRFVRR